MTRLSLLSLMLLLVLCWGCDQPAKKQATKEKKVKKLEGLVQHYYDDGSLASEINYKDKKRHGYAKGYFKNGSVQGEFNYEEGELHGITKMYYENGNIFRETPYTHGKKDGVEKLYRQSGQLLAEVPYKNDELGLGTIEYTKEGKPKKQLPQLKVEQIDKLLKNNQYIIRISLSERNGKTRFYFGELQDGKYKGGGGLNWIPDKNGVAELVYNMPPGTFMMETIQIVAETETKMKTPYLISTKVNVAIENKGY
ncbi:toxin-antitoxin system YwqK family antitoxin [Cesiribacter sp. SM1]|uniref:toxin-antitoxin system YwqK family antitoxin n=1 Tax=Cesiribacter sp. SM1 TaxID=2861196 RepID=UPI001CD7881B|nr:hypothetical protein [Cesiribacter sp. SM1]